MTQHLTEKQPEVFTDPTKPTMVFIDRHEHDWYEVAAEQSPNGVWHSVWCCTLCPDVGLGGRVGPVPVGFCFRCGWVQRKANRRKCEECGSPKSTIKQT